MCAPADAVDEVGHDNTRCDSGCNGLLCAGNEQVMRRSEQWSGPAAATERFEHVFRANHAAVVAYVRRRAARDVVDDVVGETFLVAWRRLDRVPDQALPWLLAVARNVLATQRRGAFRRDALLLRLHREPGGQQGVDAGDGADGRIAAALAKLAPKDREALTLIAWDGLAPHEAALVLGEAPGTFRVRLHRARTRLRGVLAERPEPSRPDRDRRPLIAEEAAHD
jgi:RNA polymerase sigma-70 factor (ECF subfamily)